MSVRFKLIVIILFVALVPLAVSAYSSLRIHQRAFDAKIVDSQRATAEYAAALAHQHLDGIAGRIEAVARPIPWTLLGPEERDGALSLIYAQHSDIAVVQLLDGRGEGQRASIHRGDEASEMDAGHPLVSLPMLDAFSKHIRTASGDSVVLGDSFVAASGQPPMLPISIPVPGESGVRWTVAVGLSLRSLCTNMSALAPQGLSLQVVDPRRRVACPPELAGNAPAGSLSYPSASSSSAVARYDKGGVSTLGSVAAAEGGWFVVSEQPAETAYAASTRIRGQTLFWIALSIGVALLGGWFLAREISRPVTDLAAGARELAHGNLDYRLTVRSDDEFGGLATAFNHMSEEIEKRDGEIRQFNEELQGRVDERTRELKEAQAQLLQSQKLAAVSSLAAGVSHEINNPLTSILGLAQVVESRVAKLPGAEKLAKPLSSIGREALRIRDIVQTLGRLAEDSKGEGFRSVEIGTIVDEALPMVEGRAAETAVSLVRETQRSLPEVRANQQQLGHALAQVVDNAITASDSGDTIRIAAADVDGQMVRLVVADTGRGIPAEHLDRVFEPLFTTKDNWESRGLGLTVAHRIVTEHHGTIKVESEVGMGTTVTILLPVARAGSHLV